MEKSLTACAAHLPTQAPLRPSASDTAAAHPLQALSPSLLTLPRATIPKTDPLIRRSHFLIAHLRHPRAQSPSRAALLSAKARAACPRVRARCLQKGNTVVLTRLRNALTIIRSAVSSALFAFCMVDRRCPARGVRVSVGGEVVSVALLDGVDWCLIDRASDRVSE
jgi:hypothetical protein